MRDSAYIGLMADSWRVCMICTIRPIAEVLSSTLRELGHDPVALVAPRRPEPDQQPEFLRLTPASAPAGVDLLFAKDKWSIERLLRAYEPDLTVCWGFPWKVPQAALDAARLGSINGHPALLPRHRGPIPFAWTLRAGDTEWGFTWHRMDAELDTGNILAQGSDPIRDDDCDIAEFGPRLLQTATALLVAALDRVAAGDPGDPQPAEGATWAGHFEDDDYVRVDWSQPARRVHNQVRAWQFTFGMSGIRAPIAILDGEELVLLQTRLADPGDGARRVECGDGPIWIVASEPV
jgi:methionyl-tRNA formyltransferase